MIGAWPSARVDRRQALTLLELLLVVALLTALAGVSWPLLQKPLESVRLRRAADGVRAEWSAARVAAMVSGQIHAFRFAQESDGYAVAPWEDPVGANLAASGAVATIDSDGARRETAQLPEGIVFVASGSVPDGSFEPAAATTSSTDSLSGDSDADFSGESTVLFYPDGTTSDATLTLRNAQAATVAILLRGLTGASRVGEVRFAKEESP